MSKKPATSALKTPSSSRLVRPTDVTKSTQNLASAIKGKSQLASGVAEKYAASLMKKMAPDSTPATPATLAEDPKLSIGDRVVVGGSKPGVVAFVGETKFAPGEWVGVHLDAADGKNDGSVAGVRYFTCEPLKGVFSKAAKITLESSSRGAGGGVSDGAIDAKPLELTSDSRSSSGFYSEASTPVDPTTPSSTPSPTNPSPTNPSSTTSSSINPPSSMPPPPSIRKSSMVTPMKKADDSRRSSLASTTSTSSTRLCKGPSKLSRLQPPSHHGSTTSISAAEASAGGGDTRLRVGDRVVVGGTKVGNIKFIGQTNFAKGEWAGIALDEPIGKNDGQVEGKRYFKCPPNFGLFAPVAKVSRLSSGCSRAPSVASTTPGMKSIPRSGMGGKTGSQSSLNSLGSAQSARSGRVRLGVTGCQQPGKQVTSSGQLSTSALERTLKEKEEHLEQLLSERDFERTELARSEAKAEELERQLIESKSEQTSLQDSMQQLQQRHNELNNKLEEEMKKIEDFQFNLEEAAIEKAELENQRISDKRKIEMLLKGQESGEGGGGGGGGEGGGGGGGGERMMDIGVVLNLEEEIRRLKDERDGALRTLEEKAKRLEGIEAVMGEKDGEMERRREEFDEKIRLVQAEVAAAVEKVKMEEKEAHAQEVVQLTATLESLKEELTKAQKVREDCEKEMETMKEDGSKNAGEVEREKNERIEILKGELKEEQCGRQELERCLKEEKEKMMKMEEEVRRVEERGRNAEKMLKDAEERLGGFEMEGKKASEGMKDYEEKFKELNEKLKVSEEKEKNAQAQLEKVTKEDLVRVTEELTTLKSSAETSKVDFDAKLQEVASLQKQLDELKAENSLLSAKLSDDLHSTTSVFEERVAVLGKEKEALSGEVDLLRQQLTASGKKLEEVVEEGMSEKKHMNSEVEKMTSEIVTLKQQMVENEKSCSDLKEELDLAKKDALDKDGLVEEGKKTVMSLEEDLALRCSEVESLKEQLNETNILLEKKVLKIEALKEAQAGANETSQQAAVESEKEKEDLKQKLSALQAHLEMTEKSLVDVKKGLEEVEGEKERIIKEGAEREERFKKASMEHEDEVTKYKNGEKDLTRRVAELTEEVKLKSDSLQIFSEKTQSASDNLQTEVMQLTRQVEALKIEVFESEKVVAALKEEKQREVEAALKDRERLVDEHEGKKEKTKQEMNEVAKKLQESIEKASALEGLKNQLEKDVKEADEKVCVAEEALKRKEEQLVSKVAELEGSLSSKEAEVGAVKKEVEDMKAVLEKKEAESRQKHGEEAQKTNVLESALLEKESQIGDLKKQIEKLTEDLNKNEAVHKDSIEEVRKEGELLKTNIVLLEEEKGRVSTENEELKGQISRLKEAESSSEAKNETTENKMEGLLEEMNGLKAELEEKGREKERLLGELSELKGSFAAKEGEVEALRTQATTEEGTMAEKRLKLQESLSRVEREKGDLDGENKKLQEQLKELSGRLEEEKGGKEESGKKYQELEGTIVSLREENDLLRFGHEGEVRQLMEKLKSGESQVEGLNSSVKQLQQQVVAKEQELKETILKHQQESNVIKQQQQHQQQQQQQLQQQPTVQNTHEPAANQQEVENLTDQVDFLNSVIVDIQKKNEALQKQLDVALDDNLYCNTSGSNNTFNENILNRIPPRLFCDICDCFDLHDTDDCPKQAGWYDESADPSQTPPSKHGGSIENQRPYCDSCEVFGHLTEDCADDQTF